MLLLIVKIIKLVRENNYVLNLLSNNDRFHRLETMNGEGDSGNTSPSVLDDGASPALSAAGAEGGEVTGMANPSATMHI